MSKRKVEKFQKDVRRFRRSQKPAKKLNKYFIVVNENGNKYNRVNEKFYKTVKWFYDNNFDSININTFIEKSGLPFDQGIKYYERMKKLYIIIDLYSNAREIFRNKRSISFFYK